MDNPTSDLDAWLDATQQRYVVQRTLHATPYEVTEVVYRPNEQGNPTVGPFVRKRYDLESQRGQAYESILLAQTSGRRLGHQPWIYECEHTPQGFEVIMEYVHGQTLYDLVRSAKPGMWVVSRFMPELCDAVRELHESFEQPLIHRDLKPSNIMLASDRLVLIDLGIARTYRSDASRDTVRYGTPGYAPPEQFGYGQTSVRSDVYALGMTLAFCLTGEEPSPQLCETGFADPRIPLPLRQVLVRATQFDPARRYGTVHELAQDIAQAIATLDPTMPAPVGLPTSAGPSPETPTNAPRARRLRVSEALGIVWNSALLLVWGVMVIGCASGVANPTKALVGCPTWSVALSYLCMVFIPWTLLSYLLMDKRWLRKHEPFKHLSWRQELPVCLSTGVVSILFAYAIYRITRP